MSLDKLKNLPLFGSGQGQVIFDIITEIQQLTERINILEKENRELRSRSWNPSRERNYDYQRSVLREAPRPSPSARSRARGCRDDIKILSLDSVFDGPSVGSDVSNLLSDTTDAAGDTGDVGMKFE